MNLLQEAFKATFPSVNSLEGLIFGYAFLQLLCKKKNNFFLNSANGVRVSFGFFPDLV